MPTHASHGQLSRKAATSSRRRQRLGVRTRVIVENEQPRPFGKMEMVAASGDNRQQIALGRGKAFLGDDTGLRIARHAAA